MAQNARSGWRTYESDPAVGDVLGGAGHFSGCPRHPLRPIARWAHRCHRALPTETDGFALRCANRDTDCANAENRADQAVLASSHERSLALELCAALAFEPLPEVTVSTDIVQTPHRSASSLPTPRINSSPRLVAGAGREAHVQGSIVRATRKPTPLDQWPVSSE